MYCVKAVGSELCKFAEMEFFFIEELFSGIFGLNVSRAVFALKIMFFLSGSLVVIGFSVSEILFIFKRRD